MPADFPLRPCRALHPFNPAGCGLCRRLRDAPDKYPQWTGQGQGPATPPACPFEGPVTEAAVCQCGDPEARHVRHCLHPAAEHGRCTRGPNSGADPDVRSCAGCPLRP